MKIRTRSGVVCASISVLFLLAFAVPARSVAQASSTASKAAGLSAFAGYVNSNPQYGTARDSGESFGVNFIRYLPHSINPSIEGRYNLTRGTNINENSFLGGIRIQTDVLAPFKVHPYGDFLMGSGTVKFNTSAPGTTSVSSGVYSFGGGVDIDLIKRFQLKADYQYQHWKLGEPSTPFTPNLLLIGVTYQFHFRDYVKQGDYQY